MTFFYGIAEDQLSLAASSAATPSICSEDDATSGIYFPNSGTEVAISQGGVEQLRVDSTGVTMGGSLTNSTGEIIISNQVQTNSASPTTLLSFPLLSRYNYTWNFTVACWDAAGVHHANYIIATGVWRLAIGGAVLGTPVTLLQDESSASLYAAPGVTLNNLVFTVRGLALTSMWWSIIGKGLGSY